MDRPSIALAAALALVASGAWLARRDVPGVEVDAVRLPGALGLAALRFRPVGAPVGTALLAHGITASKETMFTLGEALARAGFLAVAFDFPGHGETKASFRRGSDDGLAIAEALHALGTTSPTVAVGHSMGGYALADAIARGETRPARHVVLGAIPGLPRTEPALAIEGSLEELLPPREVDAWSARTRWIPGVRRVFADHALEPFMPGSARAVVGFACEEAPCRPATLAGIGARAAGLALVLLGVGLGWWALPEVGAARRARRPFRGWALGAAASSATLLALHLGVGRAYLGTGISASRLPTWLLVAATTLASSSLLAAALARGRRRPAAWVHGGMLCLVLLGAVVAASFGARFAAMVAFLAMAPLGFAWAVAARAEARLGSAAGHAVFAVLLGFLVATWLPR